MKWKLNKENFETKDSKSQKKSMSYEANEKSKENIIFSKHPPPPSSNPTSPEVAATLQKYKIHSSDATVASDEHHSDRCHFKRRLSLEEALKGNDLDDDGRHRHQHHHYNQNKKKHHGDIFVITSNSANKLTQPPLKMPWTSSMTTTSPSASAFIISKNVSGGDPANGCNLDPMMLDNYASETNNDFHFINTTTANPSSTGSLNKNGSTTKLLPTPDDQSAKQSKSSLFRGLILCLCLNVTYANVVRFPRELERHGSAFLVPYFIILLLVGLPIILLEVSIGQFLGQGSANSWRASPIFKGACVIGRFASWLSALWISLQAVLAIVYIGMLIFKAVPFSACASGVKIIENSYSHLGTNGQECISRTFLTPVWNDTLFYTFLTMSLVFLWIITMPCTHNSKVFRRMMFFFGLLGFGLLVALTGWEVHKSLQKQCFPEIWAFDETLFFDSILWFNALVQVIFSTNIGFGVIPVVTGKFLHKGDAVRTTIVYLCFNLLVNAIAVILFMVQFDNGVAQEPVIPYPELKAITAIYDNVLSETDIITTRILPGLVYFLVVIASIVSIATAIYTASRLVPRHPNYVLSFLALAAGILALVGPDFVVARVLDSRLVGTLAICALVFDLIATIWVYGAKNIYTDLEFSIGRPIFKSWIVLWCFAPAALTAILVWWCVGDDQLDVLYPYLPRWAPLIFVLAIIVLIASIEISKQVDYNFFGMICEAAKPAKEWGPADPLARHAWKQWRSVCQDTGRKDFTLRRRGTRDYTHSIKKGQYSAAKYGTPNWKTSTPGSSSPNYSGSVFGDSAIEEDMSVDKYSGVTQQFTIYSPEHHRQFGRFSSRSRKISQERRRHSPGIHEKHKDNILYIRRPSADSSNNTNSTKIEITPTSDTIVYGTSKNPMARPSTLSQDSNRYSSNSNSNSSTITNKTNFHKDSQKDNGDHICWRKFSVNSEEYSTEL